uniref:apoptosis inhibitor 5 n=1 Tax=Ciona intestinalis TaxID=7719 RepID=UPI000180BF24|nr:apoptosis inhibitor 5 [Ciona intestinalis]|eukprot:XP_002131739.1 apoptosis inhibitor 5 [Ciona intestinalis]
MSVDVEQLYKSFGVLADAKDNAKEHPEAYKTILKGVEGTSAAKRLSAQFTSRFFKHFPDLSESAINALLDLCEDDDPSIRKAAIKELPNLCKSSKEHVSRLSDVLVQLLVSEESSEVSAVNSALNGLFTLDSKGTLTGVLSQILSGDDEVREKAITYLCTRLKSCSEADMSKETEEYVLEQLKKVLEDVTGGEFQKLMQALSGLHHLQTIQGRQQLVNIIADQLKLDQDFDPKDTDSLNRISQCISMALPLCSRNVHSSPFINYMCQKVLPQLSLIGCSEAVNGDSKPEVNQPDLKLEILKELSDLCAHCGATEIQDSIQPLFQSLVDFMPLPPTDESEDGSSAPKPKLHFSYVECLMHSFHQLGRHNSDFFTSEEAAAKLKDFRIRLQYFARGVQVYIKELKTSLAGKSPTELRTEKENQIKLVALKTCNNINTLIRDLFHNPPAYKASINVSWKKTTAAPKASPAKPQKRPSTGGNDNDDKKKERTLYRTPSGKYSSNISPGRGGYSNKRGGRKWGGGRGQYY